MSANMAVVGLILTVSVFLCVKAEVIDEAITEDYTPHIWGILNYFNSDPDRIYNYNIGALESAQKTEHGLFLRIETQVECRLNPTDPRCGHRIHICEAFVQYNEGIDRYEILPGASCHPKYEEGTGNSKFRGEPQVQSSSVLQVNEEPTNSGQISHEITPESGAADEEFVAVRRDSSHCVGCVIDLDKNVEGLPALISTALKHIESERDKKHVLLNVLRVQQQVVAGIKYILLLEIAPTVCSKDVQTVTPELCPLDQSTNPQVCNILYLQKPWISLQKHIIANNCTTSQEFIDVNKRGVPNIQRPFLEDLDNEIDINDYRNQYPNDISDNTNNVPNFDVIGNTGRFDISPSALADIESQIEIEKTPASKAVQDTSTANVQIMEEKLEKRNEVIAEEQNLKDVEQVSEDSLASAGTTPGDIQQKQEVQLDTAAPKIPETPLYPTQSENKNLENVQTQLREVAVPENLQFQNENFDNVQAQVRETVVPENLPGKNERKKRSVGSKYSYKKSSSYNKQWLRKLAVFVVDQKLGPEKHNVLEVLYPKQQKSEKLGGLIYSFLITIDTPTPNQTETCKTKVLFSREKSERKILKFKCYNNKRKSNKKLSRVPRRAVSPGGVWDVSVSDPEIGKVIQSSLLQLNLNSGQTNKYKVVEIISASKQVVAGLLYRIKAKLVLTECSHNDLQDPQLCSEQEGEQPRMCNIKIWDRPWLPNGRETNITCENDEIQYSFKSKRSVEYQSRKKRSAIERSKRSDYDVGAFKYFMRTYNKTYTSKKEYQFRLKVFQENLKMIEILNKYERGTGEYGITMFADLTREEFSRYTGLRTDLRNYNEIANHWAKIPDIDLPVEFDWRTKGAVTEVKNQGSCGSCWAFSVTGNIEGQYAIKHGQLLEFSEQELVDCDTSDDGCGGGLMDNAYRAIEKLGGLETEGDYPYDAERETCHFKKNLVKVELSGAVNISTNETDMAKWLVKNGPISIGINANAMQFYIGGVSHPWSFLCSPNSIDHGVLIVGYGVHKYPYLKKTLPYWLVKNSWGKSWGQQGYYLVYRGDGTCGLNKMPSSAVVE